MVKKATSLFSVDVINPELSRRPAHIRIAARVRAAILSTALKPDARLPSSRTLARDFGVARNTVDEALNQLVAEGLIVRRRGAGSFVSHQPPQILDRHSPSIPPRAAARISHRAQQLRRYPGHFTSISSMPFTPSLPPGEFFPRNTWKRLLNREAARPGATYWEYGASNGLPALREAIAGHANALRGTRAAADQVIVTTSTQQAVELAAKVLADPGDSCWVENPGYQPAQHVLSSAGLDVVRVPVDEHGIDVDAACRLRPGARLAYVTPSHQFPLGYEMSPARRQSLLAWARSGDNYIVEDDYDGDYRYEGKPITSLQEMDPDRVIYTGSFNKILFPGLRIAYALVPVSLINAFVDAKHISDGHTALLSQGVLAAFINDGHLAHHLRTTRLAYNDRRLAFMEEARVLSEWVEFGPAVAGIHVTGVFGNPTLDDRKISAACAVLGVSVDPLSKFGESGRRGLVFGFAGASRDATRHRLRIVHRAISDEVSSGASA
jgi:GntR family transcriptional regulator/MocR family aminotransferase